MLARAALEAVDIPIQVVDSELRLSWMNPAFVTLCENLGLSLENASGRQINTVLPFLGPHILREYRLILKTGKPLFKEETQRIGDRNVFIESQKFPVRTGGSITHVVTLLRDITQRQQAMLTLQESEERSRRQFQAIPIPTFVWQSVGDDFVLRDFNVAADKLTLGRISGFVGRHASDMYRHRPDILADLKACAEGRSLSYRDMLYGYESIDVDRYLQVHYAYIPPDLVMVHTIDLTERKKIETDLQAAHDELEGRVRDRTEALSRQIEFDALITGMLTHFTGCSLAEIDRFVEEGLRDVARFIGADNAFVLLSSSDSTSFSATHLWRADGVLNGEEMYGTYPKGTWGEIEEAVMSGQTVVLDSPDDIPSSAAEFRMQQKMLGVKSMLTIPLRGRGGLINGCIGIRVVVNPHHWSEEDIRRLGMAGDAIASALERKQIELAMRQGEEKYRALVETTGTGYVILDEEGKVLDANREYVRLTGHSNLDEIRGRSVLDWTAPQELKKNADAVIECMARGRISGFEIDYIDHDGTITPIEVDATVVETDGKPRILALCHNIVARKKFEEEVTRANEQLSVEREALSQKNTALQELLVQLRESKKSVAAQIQANMERIVLPLIDRLERKIDKQAARDLQVVRNSVVDIVSPFVSSLETRFRSLTPREIEICNLVRRGYSSKEIAELRSSSVQTVLKQRKAIRKKLGLSGQDVNLASFLAVTGTSRAEQSDN